MYKILCFISPICRRVLWYSVVWFDIQVTLHTRLISVLSVIQRMPLLFTELASHCSVCPLSLHPGIKTNMYVRKKRLLVTAAPSLKHKRNPLGERGIIVWIYGITWWTLFLQRLFWIYISVFPPWIWLRLLQYFSLMIFVSFRSCKNSFWYKNGHFVICESLSSVWKSTCLCAYAWNWEVAGTQIKIKRKIFTNSNFHK